MRKAIFRALIILIASLAILLIWLKWQWILGRYGSIPDDLTISRRGQYGDSYGSLNTLFTGFAFLAVAYTLFLQIADTDKRDQESKERDKQRAEEARRHEHERQEEAERFKREAERIERDSTKLEAARFRDNFEGNFFRLVDIWRSCISEMAVTGRQGYSALNYIATMFEHAAKSRHDFTTAYQDIYKDFLNQLDPYFRALYYVFRYVDKADIAAKSEYTDIVRGLLSYSELLLLTAHSLQREAQFTDLVKKFHLLKHLPRQVSWIPWPELNRQLTPQAFNDD